MPLDIAHIQACRPQNRLHYWESLGSTMTEAGRLAAAGAPHGTAVLANEQTAGLGRLGRSWISEPEDGIYCSVLLRLPLPLSSMPVASLLVGLAAAGAIHKSANLVCDLRWPNDVLINERKVAGILTHLVDGCVVAGIGINVNQRSFEPGLRTAATSLRMESHGEVYPRESIIVNLLVSLEEFCEIVAAKGPAAICRCFAEASSYVTNRRVIIEESGATGVTCGLDENGFLLVRYDSGQVERIAAGGIRPRKPSA